MSDETRDSRIYEIGYLILPTVGDAKIGDVVSVIKKTIEHHKGVEISEGRPELIDLAYIMSKIIENKRNSFETAYFGWIKFEISPDTLDSIKSMFDSNGDILRYLLVSTVREDTMVKKKPIHNRRVKTHTDPATVEGGITAPEEVKEVNEAELEEKLQTMVE